MKNYTVTFGKGKESINITENNCTSFAEAVMRLEYTGFDMTEMTKVKSENV